MTPDEIQRMIQAEVKAQMDAFHEVEFAKKMDAVLNKNFYVRFCASMMHFQEEHPHGINVPRGDEFYDTPWNKEYEAKKKGKSVPAITSKEANVEELSEAEDEEPVVEAPSVEAEAPRVEAPEPEAHRVEEAKTATVEAEAPKTAMEDEEDEDKKEQTPKKAKKKKVISEDEDEVEEPKKKKQQKEKPEKTTKKPSLLQNLRSRVINIEEDLVVVHERMDRVDPQPAVDLKKMDGITITPQIGRIQGVCAVDGCKEYISTRAVKCEKHKNLVIAYDKKLLRKKTEQDFPNEELWQIVTREPWATNIDNGTKKGKVLPKRDTAECVGRWTIISHADTQEVKTCVILGEAIPIDDAKLDEKEKEALKTDGFDLDKCQYFPIVKTLTLKESIVMDGKGQPGPIRVEDKKTRKKIWAAMKQASLE